MRQFTTGDSFHDNDGKLLVGRITFYKFNTTTLQNVYNINGQVIDNPIYTNQIGQTNQQVFLDDVDYTIRFEKYIGNGNMETDTDTRHWSFQYSSVNLYDTFNIKVESSSIMTISNIETLRNTDPTTVSEQSGYNIIQLAGYNTPGDKPIVEYIWDNYSEEVDNGGSVIKVNNIGRGRWLLLSNDLFMDVRHFGAFPTNAAANLTEEQAYCIQYANQYASTHGKVLYFPLGNYRIQSNISSAKFDKDTYVYVPDNTNVEINLYSDEENFKLGQNSIHDYEGNCYVYGKELHMDCIFNANPNPLQDRIFLYPSEKFTIDKNITSYREISGVDVYINNDITCANVDLCKLINCDIHSNKALGKDFAITLENCIVKEGMFDDNMMISKVKLIDCSIDLSNFIHVMQYIKLKNSMNDNNYGDLKGMKLDTSVELLNNAILYNATGKAKTNNNYAYTIENSNIELSDYVYSLTANNSTVKLPYAENYTCRNCDITETEHGDSNKCYMYETTYWIQNEDEKTLSNYHFWNCDIVGYGILNLANKFSTIDETNFHKDMEIIASRNVVITNSKFGKFTALEEVETTIDNCILYKDVILEIWPDMKFTFKNNSIEGTLQFKNSGNYRGISVADAKIVHNTQTTDQPLVKWATNALAENNEWFGVDDASHTYVYYGNVEWNSHNQEKKFSQFSTSETTKTDEVYTRLLEALTSGTMSSDWHVKTNIDAYCFSFGKTSKKDITMKVYFCDEGNNYVTPPAYSNTDYKKWLYGETNSHTGGLDITGSFQGVIPGHDKRRSFEFYMKDKGTMKIDNKGRRLISLDVDETIHNTFGNFYVLPGTGNPKVKFLAVIERYI